MENSAELESFRRQWREEVAHRTKTNNSSTLQAKPTTSTSSVRPSQFPPARHEAAQRKEEDEEGTAAFGTTEIVQGVGQLNIAHDEDAFHSQEARKEPTSALEHFERAVEKEAEGNLGDSLQHYRKAYRLDSAVDKTYRNKHFAWAWKKPAQTPAHPANNPSKDQQTQDEPEVLPTPELIASFAHLPIAQPEPLFKGDPQPPCPIAHVPSEVIVEILRHVAVMDPAAMYRMSLVCKRFAWHFAHEQHIWKRLCQGSEFGFKSMHYSFSCDILGHPEHTLSSRSRYTPFPNGTAQIPKPLSSWSEVFQMFPRIRFTGIYISTVNYTRAGAASFYQNVTWNSPIHIVTYYRYLRFYPDGTVLALLSTVEPLDLVPHISIENVLEARASHKHHRRQPLDAGKTVAGAPDPIPAVAMRPLRDARRGRWRLANPFPLFDTPGDGVQMESGPPSVYGGKDLSGEASDPRDVIIETESGGSSSINVLHMSLRSSTAHRSANSTTTPSNASKNTKLIWKGYWSYEKLTDDWAEYGLRNDRAFVFRRVRGWGMS
ncbi:F-box only protein 9 [Aspergillus alliaceus]|uniref:F-box only protein 9 n=1 Tax=Petromyces alliaceus TaxID=209559 RepID=A0A8H6E4Z2_PETAA|nr:F-box only protein 9 [Aspergillus burnettii]